MKDDVGSSSLTVSACKTVSITFRDPYWVIKVVILVYGYLIPLRPWRDEFCFSHCQQGIAYRQQYFKFRYFIESKLADSRDILNEVVNLLIPFLSSWPTKVAWDSEQPSWYHLRKHLVTSVCCRRIQNDKSYSYISGNSYTVSTFIPETMNFNIGLGYHSNRRITTEQVVYTFSIRRDGALMHVHNSRWLNEACIYHEKCGSSHKVSEEQYNGIFVIPRWAARSHEHGWQACDPYTVLSTERLTFHPSFTLFSLSYDFPKRNSRRIAAICKQVERIYGSRIFTTSH